MSKNFGFKFEPSAPEDRVFGFSQTPYELLQASGDWTTYLPKKELQNTGVETFACVTFTILNCVEILIKRKYGLERNYSDRFLAALSETKDGGNTPKKVAQTLRKRGVVKQELYPFEVNSFAEFYQALPPNLKAIAQEFLDEFDFQYEEVRNDPEEIRKALQSSPLGISVSAWYKNENGRYYFPEGARNNHFTTLVKMTDTYKQVFDTYDNVIKDLEMNTNHLVIQRYHIERRKDKKNPCWYCDIAKEMWDFIRFIFGKRV